MVRATDEGGVPPSDSRSGERPVCPRFSEGPRARGLSTAAAPVRRGASRWRTVRSGEMDSRQKFKCCHLTQRPPVSRTMRQKIFPFRRWDQSCLNVTEHVRVENRLQAHGINTLQHGNESITRRISTVGGRPDQAPLLPNPVSREEPMQLAAEGSSLRGCGADHTSFCAMV
jgi:hypothetical protein